MVFQQFNLFPHLSAGRNVMLAPMIVVKKTSKAECESHRARDAREGPGLGEKFDAYPEQLSGGQQQRVAIARALAMQAARRCCATRSRRRSTPNSSTRCWRSSSKLASEGMTLVMVTHEMRFAREVGDKLVFMHQGRVHEVGHPATLMAHPGTPELAAFVGSSAH